MSQVVKPLQTGEISPDIVSIAMVAVGSNKPFREGDPTETVDAALRQISAEVGVIRACSRMYRTPAFPPGSGPDFVNAAIALETKFSPRALLAELHRIEAAFGRDRRQRWAPRTLDLDLVGMDQTILPDLETYLEWKNLPLSEQMERAPDGLILPHPRLHERAFVLIPLSDVASEWIHPISGQSVAQMCQALPNTARQEVQAL